MNFKSQISNLKSKFRRRLRYAALALLLLMLAFAGSAYLFPAFYLCKDSGPAVAKADYIVVLGGGNYERPLRAAELFREGAAPRIIITGRGDEEINRSLLLKHGVPARAILVEGESATTWENAVFTARLIREREKVEDGRAKTGDGAPPQPSTLNPQPTDLPTNRPTDVPSHRPTVILVTSWYHSHRALRTFQKVAPEMTFYSRPSYYGYKRAEWSREGITGHLWIEYAKFARYVVLHRIWPI